jgi:hypothetical protein
MGGEVSENFLQRIRGKGPALLQVKQTSFNENTPSQAVV